ncbi:acetyltransferase [Frankia sp. Cj3]|uniref:acetyltransferase n=1 Tax=Frankia sp. Cj3 TaxID=2880976 RepID=UPI001EF6EDB8|nr:acetyltransferase [Frankia sp. Cj3]
MSHGPTALVVVGAGGHGRELMDVVEAVNAVRPTYELLGVVDDGQPDLNQLFRREVRHLGPVRLLAEIDAEYVVGIGAPAIRRAVDSMATAWGRQAATLVHPRAVIGRDVLLGSGNVVCALASITTNVRTGRHVHLNIAATVAHDCRLGDYVTLSPGAHVSGTVTLEDDVTIGTGAMVIQGLTIGTGTTVGAGAAVIRSLPAGVVAVGVPARPRVPVTVEQNHAGS